MEFTIGDIAALLGGLVSGDNTLKISRLEKIQDATPGSVSFLSNLKYEPYVYTTQASAVIVNKGFVPRNPINTALILVDDAYTAFSVLLEQYQKFVRFAKNGIEQPSYLGENTLIGELVYRGAFSYIGKNCRLGNNVKIYPHAYIGDGVNIGDNTIIYAGARINDNTQIGKFCTIQPGAVIGSDGFGFAPQADGSYKTIPQVGNVILEDNVDIGANTVVDCATMGSTIIRQGVKLDNLIQIAHNVVIGKNTVIAAQAGISGSSSIGENCQIGGQVGLIGHITVANGTKIGAQSGIAASVEEPDTTLIGSPAFEIKQFLRSFFVFKKLPELNRKVAELERKLKN